jgi:hypothetical protein
MGRWSVVVAAAIAGCAGREKQAVADVQPPPLAPPPPQPHPFGGTAQEQMNRDRLYDLDFDVLSDQRWDDLERSHAAYVVVHWPDGRTTPGLGAHINDLREIFAYAPDTHLDGHTVRLADGDYTSVNGTLRGTFSAPMPVPGGVIEPTGRSFELPLAMIGRWQDGLMVEEWLFWDNRVLRKQIGLE